jgi:hypothetical protein
MSTGAKCTDALQLLTPWLAGGKPPLRGHGSRMGMGSNSGGEFFYGPLLRRGEAEPVALGGAEQLPRYHTTRLRVDRDPRPRTLTFRLTALIKPYCQGKLPVGLGLVEVGLRTENGCGPRIACMSSRIFVGRAKRHDLDPHARGLELRRRRHGCGSRSDRWLVQLSVVGGRLRRV